MKPEANKSRAVLATALNLQIEELGDSPTTGVTASWNSLAHMRLIIEMESVLDGKLEPMEIVSMTGLSDVEMILTGG